LKKTEIFKYALLDLRRDYSSNTLHPMHALVVTVGWFTRKNSTMRPNKIYQVALAAWKRLKFSSMHC